MPKLRLYGAPACAMYEQGIISAPLAFSIQSAALSAEKSA
jgi:hypothetical protein